jgi:hypothetical protein
MTKKNKEKLETNEEIYLNALQKIKILTMDLVEDFEPSDDPVTHYLEGVYDELAKWDLYDASPTAKWNEF